MPRLRNTRTGVVVEVDDDTAARMGSEYEPAEPARKSAPRKRASKPDDD